MKVDIDDELCVRIRKLNPNIKSYVDTAVRNQLRIDLIVEKEQSWTQQ